MKKIYLTTLLGIFHFFLSAQTEFITTWKTDNDGVSADNQITIPTFSGETYNYSVTWGDGSSDSNVTGDITHTYAAPGTYTVSITGIFPRIYFNFLGDGEKLLTLEQWGNNAWSSMEAAFAACLNLNVLATDAPNLTNVTSMKDMFNSCSFLQVNDSMSHWDTSTVTDMSLLFASASNFNANISQWDTSNVTNMSGMFIMNDVFNQPIGAWDTSSVQDMNSMFNMTGSFNQDIGSWDVGNVTNTVAMFREAQAFNQDIGNWNVGQVKYMGIMFAGAKSFNQDIGGWNVSEVIDMLAMFQQASAFNQDISNWDVNKVTRMLGMFDAATSFNQPLNGWDVSNVTNMFAMFADATSFNQPLDNWNVSSVTDMTNLFLRATSFDQKLGNWDVGQVTSMVDMFRGTELSQENYDDILLGWGNLVNLQNDVNFNVGSSVYCNGEVSRKTLIEEFGWVITDSGKDCPFITTWKTDNPGVSESNQITIPTFSGETYDYTVDWGDGTSDSGIVGDMTHTYAQPGTYQVSISGDFPRIYFNDFFEDSSTNDADKILTVDQWGSIQWTSMMSAFMGCANLDVAATDVPDLTDVTSIYSIFALAKKLVYNETINEWDTSSITQMGQAFSVAHLFNQPLGNWDVSNVTGMARMFQSAFEFNQDIRNWDVGNVRDMQSMLIHAREFNQDIGDWNVSNVTNMSGLFWDTPFNQDISRWDTSNVTSMYGMFVENEEFNQDIGNWNVSSVKDMGNMFVRAVSFNQDISNWDVSSVESMFSMFSGATSFDQNLGDWNIGQVNEMSEMFLDVGLSTVNYDQTLLGWSELSNLQNDINFNAGDSRYCESTDARQLIIDTYGWTIDDAGEDPLCNQDTDADGVLDHKDSCLGTPPGVEVDANGCDIVPNDAIKVYVLTPSCIGSSDGSVEITMNISGYSLDISLNGEGLSDQFDDIQSETGLEINDLSAGSYTIKVLIPEIFFEQTYGVTVNELGSITGKRTILNSTKGTVTYSVEGSETYEVLVNGKPMDFSFADSGPQTISLKNLKGQTEIAISGESDCQGKISDNFFMGRGIQVYPTVTSSQVGFFTEGDQLRVRVFSLDGRLVKEENYDQYEKSMDVSSLESGLYFLQMEMEGRTETIKIIKK